MGRNNPELTYERIHKTGRPRKAIVDGKQQCSVCLEWKELATHFGPSKVAASGYETRCKTCNTARGQRHRMSSVENAMQHLWYSHKRLGRRGSSRRASLADSSCVTPEMLVRLWKKQDGKCAVTAVPMTYITAQGNVGTNASIDRIDSQFGYIPDNVRLVCRSINLMKHELTDKELIQWAALILNGPLANTSGR